MDRFEALYAFEEHIPKKKPEVAWKRQLKLLFISLIVISIPFMLYIFTRNMWGWKYTDSDFGYELRFPDLWEEVDGNQYQDAIKQFKLINHSYGADGPTISVVVYASDEQVRSDFRLLQEAANGLYVVFQDVRSIKQSNVNLHGCDAPMTFTQQVEYGYKPRYDVRCVGDQYQIDIRLSAGTINILDQHKPEFNQIVDTFRFGNLSLN